MTPKSFKNWFAGFPKTQFKTAMENTENLMKKGVQNEVYKRVVLMILGTFLRSGSKGVPGWCQGPSQGSPRVKKAPKWVSK